MKQVFGVVGGALLLVLAGCVPENRLPGDPPAAQMRKDRAQCEARGGEYAQAGLFGHACFMPTEDGFINMDSKTPLSISSSNS